jgi:hypothetical protein
MSSPLLEIEGTWEEVAVRVPELAARRNLPIESLRQQSGIEPTSVSAWERFAKDTEPLPPTGCVCRTMPLDHTVGIVLIL